MKLIFSLDTKERKASAEEYVEIARHWNGTICLGCYEGVTETSIMIDTKYPDFIKRTIFSTYKQEAVLLIDSKHMCSLVYNNGEEQAVGRWTSVSAKEAVANQNYTILKNQYFIAK